MKNSIENSFNFFIKREAVKQYYLMHTQFIQMGFDGKRKETEDYWLKLSHTPKELSGEKHDKCECKEFSISFNNEPRRIIPVLSNWSYMFNPLSGLDGGDVFGIPHEPFEKLTDDKSKAIPPDIKYAIYNNFVDYHALSNSFIMYGAGIEKIHKIGDKIIHAGAYSKAPINLKNIVKEGSVYQNGEITLELIGISNVDDKLCAVLKYDSGESTLDMEFITENGNVKTTGGSEYIGEIYLDLESGWVRKVMLIESVITERKELDQEKEKRYTVRNLQLKLILNEDLD